MVYYILSWIIFGKLYIYLSTLHIIINIGILDKISLKPVDKWKPFSKEEFKSSKLIRMDKIIGDSVKL